MGRSQPTWLTSSIRLLKTVVEVVKPIRGLRKGEMGLIAVGTPITERPPHRSERAQFGHSAPTLGV